MPSLESTTPAGAGAGASGWQRAAAEAQVRPPPQYQEIGLIGNGAYGTVYKARDLSASAAGVETLVALKKVVVALREDGLPPSTVREIALLKQLDQHEHPNIVRLLDVCHGPRLEKEHKLVLYLVFEHIDQDLSTFLEKAPPTGFSSTRLKHIMFQILCGVDFLHSHRIVHRDLKPQNVLISSHEVVKLADFGLAKAYDFEMRLTSVVVTLWYRAPEVLLMQTYATPVDMWACGCIMAEIYRLKPLFTGKSETDQLDRIFQVTGTPDEEEWPESSPVPWSSFARHMPSGLTLLVPTICRKGLALLERMLHLNPSERISASDALAHPYFADDGFERPDVNLLVQAHPPPVTTAVTTTVTHVASSSCSRSAEQ